MRFRSEVLNFKEAIRSISERAESGAFGSVNSNQIDEAFDIMEEF